MSKNFSGARAEAREKPGSAAEIVKGQVTHHQTVRRVAGLKIS